MSECRDCKYLDLSQRMAGSLCVCTNTNRKTYSKWGGYKTCSAIKAPSANACKTGFEPREEEGAE